MHIFLKQIAAAMCFLRQVVGDKEIIHRDLKPGNILLKCSKPYPPPSEIILKIADFGLSRFLAKDERAITFAGTKHYMAPEIGSYIGYGPKVDLWSIGIIICDCLALQWIPDYGLMSDTSIPLSAELRDLLHGLLKLDPEKRIDFDDFFNHPFLKEPSCRPNPLQQPEPYLQGQHGYNPCVSHIKYGSNMQQQPIPPVQHGWATPGQLYQPVQVRMPAQLYQQNHVNSGLVNQNLADSFGAMSLLPAEVVVVPVIYTPMCNSFCGGTIPHTNQPI